MDNLREQLRVTPAVVGSPPEFDVARAPEHPGDLFVDWLRAALAAGIDEPHAMTLSTVDEDGHPDARVLLLKDVTAAGVFAFSTGDGSMKGQQLRRDPRVALTFYWGALARSVRVRGVADRATPEESAADFRARPMAARAIALAGRQSDRLVDTAERDRLVSQNLARLRQDPALVSAEWTLWQVHPTSIEFWQGATDRNHLRLRYRRCDGEWEQDRLWA